MRRTLNIALAQLNFLVGDIEGNGERILKTMAEQQAAGADLVMFSELALSGYSPEDLVFRPDFHQRIAQSLTRIQQASGDCAVLVGHPWQENSHIYNALSFFEKGSSAPVISNRNCRTTACLMKNAGLRQEQKPV